MPTNDTRKDEGARPRVMHGLGVLLMTVLLLAGCSTDRPPEDFFAPNDVGVLVVDAVLIVDKPLPKIKLSRATRPDALYNSAAGAEWDATVWMYSHFDGDEVEYVEHGRRGTYIPTVSQRIVQPGATYELRVTTTKNEVVRATTTTPEQFSISEWVLLDDSGQTVQRRLRSFAELGDSVYYAPENQLVYTQGLLEARFDRGKEAGYHIGILSIDLDSDFVIDPAFFEEEDFESIERSISSPIFEAADGRTRLPWFTIFFQGRHVIRFYSVDQNWYDLILTLPEFQGGFGGEIGDGFERPNFNIQGGIGLFGSGSVDSVGFFVLPRP